MDQEPEKLEVTDAKTLAGRIRLTWNQHLDTITVERTKDVDARLNVWENLFYVYLPAALKLAASILKGTLAGNVAAIANDAIPDINQTEGKTNMDPSKINLITNVIGVIIAIIEPVKSYLTSQPFDWGTFAVCLLGAIVAYFTGKSGKFAVDNKQ